MNSDTSPAIYPLGDSAITLDLGNCIDAAMNARIQGIYRWVTERRFAGMIDTIVAYSSISVFFDPTAGGCRQAITGMLTEAWHATAGCPAADEGRSVRIPVCYEAEYGPDLDAVAREKGMPAEEVVRLHCGSVYHIYMIGFLPGFPYMGKLDPRLDVPRKTRPSPVIAGGVGIAGLQTGIYPLNSPGGWQIIGRTPLKLFDREADPPILLRAGDRVEFYPVPVAEFINWRP